LSKKPASIQWLDAQILNDVKSLFEEAENRSFDVSFPVKIEGEDCYKIIVSGKLASNQTYPIDTLAVNPNDYKRYFLDKETDTYERYFTARLLRARPRRMENCGLKASEWIMMDRADCIALRKCGLSILRPATCYGVGSVIYPTNFYGLRTAVSLRQDTPEDSGDRQISLTQKITR
jgi:hypothetical protein